MRYFPLFVALTGRPALVVGDGPAADAKAALLTRAGAEVRRRIAFDPIDLADCALVFASADGVTEEVLAAAARKQGIPVNIADRPELCDFIAPAIVERGALTIAISTGGASPMLAHLLRHRIEALLPSSFGGLVAFAESWRRRVRSRFADASSRRRYWAGVLSGRVAALVLSGRDDEAEVEMAAGMVAGVAPASRLAQVLHVSSDPDFLTLRDLRMMQEADVVIHDSRIGEDVLAMVRRDARRIEADGSVDVLAARQARGGRRVVVLCSTRHSGGRDAKAVSAFHGVICADERKYRADNDMRHP